jgi:hypothetical protein
MFMDLKWGLTQKLLNPQLSNQNRWKGMKMDAEIFYYLYQRPPYSHLQSHSIPYPLYAMCADDPSIPNRFIFSFP